MSGRHPWPPPSKKDSAASVPLSEAEKITNLAIDVEAELRRAVGRFRSFNSPHEGWAVIREELDELWEHVKKNTGRGLLNGPLAETPDGEVNDYGDHPDHPPCGARFSAWDGPQNCGRPHGHQGSHTKDPLPSERGAR